MANLNSPFSRSQIMRRSPPPTPTKSDPPADPPSNPDNKLPSEVVSTAEIQRWMEVINDGLNEICAIVGEGKMNSDQKLRVNNLCRKVANGTSQMAVMYQSLKQKTIQAHDKIENLQAQQSHANAIDQLKKTVETKMQSAELTSYAHIVKKGANNLVRPENLSAIAIYPSDKTKTSDETKALVQTIISPEAFKLQVRGIKKVRNGGVLISTENKGDIDKLRGSHKLASSGLTIEEPSKRRPRIIIIGVPQSLSEKEVLDCIYEQNLSDKVPNYTRESFAETAKISHKSGKKNPSFTNYIIEVPPTIRRVLVNQGRIFINWTSCHVRDFTIVTRCYNCQLFGHAAKFCRESTPACNHCGESGHTHKECTKKSTPPVCATCKRFKRKCDHQTGDESCPARKYAEANYINSIDYEGA